MTVDVTETGCVVQTGGNVFFLQPGERFKDIIKTVASTHVGENGPHRDACPLNHGFAVADIGMGLNAVNLH